ncbi:MAG: hypothetical protein V4544_04580 [Pseudomonadota bacterium]
MKSDLAKNGLAVLDKSDSLYGHFRVLSLIDEIASMLAGSIFGLDFDIDAAISGINEDLFIEIKGLSNITVDMFRNSFTSTHGNHSAGIVKHIEKLSATNAKPSLFVHYVTSSDSATLKVTAQNPAFDAMLNSLSTQKLTTESEKLPIDDSRNGEDTVGPLQTALVNELLSLSHSTKVEVQIPSPDDALEQKEKDLKETNTLNVSLAANSNDAPAVLPITTEVFATQDNLFFKKNSSVIVTNANQAKAEAKANRDNALITLNAAKKQKPYNEEAVAEAQRVYNELEKEVNLARAYKKAQEAYDAASQSKKDSLLGKLEATKKEYYDCMQKNKAVASRTDSIAAVDISRRNSNTSDTASSRRNSDASAAGDLSKKLEKKKSFFGF